MSVNFAQLEAEVKEESKPTNAEQASVSARVNALLVNLVKDSVAEYARDEFQRGIESYVSERLRHLNMDKEITAALERALTAPSAQFAQVADTCSWGNRSHYNGGYNDGNYDTTLEKVVGSNDILVTVQCRACRKQWKGNVREIVPR